MAKENGNYYLPIAEGFKLSYDKLDIVINERTTTKSRKVKGELNETWKKSYFPTIDSACRYILRQEIKNIEADNIQQLIDKINDVEKKITDALKDGKWTLKELNNMDGE